MSQFEIIAALLGIANIVLVARRSVWNFPVALIMVGVYGFIFWQARLYSNASLQAFFFAMNLYGWWRWSRAKAEDGELRVERLSRNGWFGWLTVSLTATLALGMILTRYTDGAAPYADAAVTVLSIAAQLLMTGRKIENWYWWIVVDLISIALYASQKLNVTAAQYTLLLGLALWGLLSWRKHARS
jgi:nicotinamide mononucleotide transporter